MGRPDPGSREPEERDEYPLSMLLGEMDDGGVCGRIQEEGDKICWHPQEGVLDGDDQKGVGGEEVHGVYEGAGECWG